MKSPERIVEVVIDLANRSDHSKAEPHLELYSAVDELCRLGPAARLIGVRSVHRIDDVTARISVAASLIAKEPGLHEGIYAEALEALSTSEVGDDIRLLSELAHIFDHNVPRSVVKSALVRAWKGSTGVLRANLAYDLRRRGHRLILGKWL